ncbi:MAG: hypothetical protein AAB343_03960 [Patescibacteria group bacterium]
MESFKIVRHLEESHQEEINRDADIDPEEIALLKTYYLPAILENIRSGKYDSATVICSDKLRSSRTADILREELQRYGDIPVNQETDDRISAEIHGRYKTGTNSDNPLIERAKMIFLHEAFEKHNVWYRHGSASNDAGEILYPELNEIFESPGENQIELNIRMYRFVLDLLQRIEENPTNLFILSAHHVVMSTLLALQRISEKGGPFINIRYHPQGLLYADQNMETEEMIGGWDNFYDYYKSRNYIFDIDVQKLKQIREIIQAELDLCLASYTQHYGNRL